MGRRGVLLSGIAIMAIFVTGAGRASLIHRNTNLPNPVRLRKVADTATDDVWFDCDLLLNQDMVATIGNKGSGKSRWQMCWRLPATPPCRTLFLSH